MAKYTELFSEYLETGGTLPANFSLIDGFEDLFKLHFCDKEIGFETEELFKLKLEEKAFIYVPLYKERIDNIAKAFTGSINPTKTYYDSSTTTLNAGKQKGSTSDLPIAAGGAVTPSSITESDAFTNNDTSESTRREEGLTSNEAMLLLDKLNNKVKSILMNLLDEFNNCFMGVY